MPYPEQYANEAATTLNGAIVSGAGSLTVASSTGFPTAGPFRVRVSGTLTAGGTGTEYMLVTAVSGTTWTVTRAVESPYNIALGFATAAAVEHVVTTVGLYESAPFVNVKSPRFAGGAKGDDATDDTAAIQAAVAYAATLGDPDTPGATVYFPPGTYRVSAATQIGSDVAIRILGAGRTATTIRRTADVSVFQFYGSAPADTGPRNIYCAMEHLHFEGGDFNTSLLDFVYVSQFQMDHVRAYGCGGTVLDLTEVWDSSFSNVFTDWCGGPGLPTVWIRNSRASSGFGASTDSSNQLKFLNLHCETFSGTAIRIEAGTGSSASPNGIYFNVVKCESAQVTSGYPYIYLSSECQTVHFDKVYCSLNAFASGSATGIDVIDNNSNGQVSIDNVEISSASSTPTLVNSGIRVNAAGVSGAFTTIDGVTGIFGQPPTVAMINVASAGGLEVDHINTTNGTLVSGFQFETQQRMQMLTADITTTSTSIADITSGANTLMFTNVLPGTYNITFWGAYQSSLTTAGPRFAFGGTATTTTPIIGKVTMATSTTAQTTTIVTAVNTTAGVNPGTATTSFEVTGQFSCTITATGTLGLRWLVSAASTGTLKGGSYAILSRNK